MIRNEDEVRAIYTQKLVDPGGPGGRWINDHTFQKIGKNKGGGHGWLIKGKSHHMRQLAYLPTCMHGEMIGM